MESFDTETMRECQDYFAKRPVFRKVFQKFMERYESLGRMGGNIRLSGLTEDEKQQLEGFLQKDYHGIKTISISCQAMEKALAGSRFSALALKDILEVYFQEHLMGNKEKKVLEEEKRRKFLDGLERFCRTKEEICWFSDIRKEKNGTYRYLLSLYQQDDVQCEEIVDKVMFAGASLPALTKQLEALAVFATRITGNPHYFDEKTAANQLLSAYLTYAYGDTADVLSSETEKKNLLFYRAGIVKDDLWNFVPVYGIHGIKADGSNHQGLDGYFREQEPAQVTLQTLGKLSMIVTENPVVYMVENPAVFSYLCKKYPKETFLCGNGQLRLAVWVLLEKMRGIQTLMYAGDFDPEGLLIAQNIKRRYPDKVRFWNYSRENYLKYLSGENISDISRKKLERITHPQLQEVKEEMIKMGMAAYQEAMLCEYGI